LALLAAAALLAGPALDGAQEKAAQPAASQNLDIRPGDHISIIGSTLADRMQHFGWLETYFQSRFPKDKLVFRNLGFAGDTLNTRLRSAQFGSPDDWLKRNSTDVVFAFFGYNESWAGAKELPQFKKDLENFIKHTQGQNYSGKGSPRLVLFSPIAFEDLKNPNLPDGKAANENLEMYTAAMAEVAAANNVPFVDLFHASKKLYAAAAKPLTINGVHQNEFGDEKFAEAIDKALFPKGPAPKRTTEYLEKIRQAVLDKNFYWFNRYRTVDGYNVFGGRADLNYGGITNRMVMQREMQVLDVMTANRDERVWKVAQGGDMKVDDSNTPPFIPVKTNLPGPLPGGKHLILGGQEEISKLTIGKNLKVNLFASEKDFPELVNPVQMAWDAKGRLWVACWPTYPHWKPRDPMNDKLIILEDTDGDGKADKCTVFADGLHCPTGFDFWNGGVLLAQGPGIVFLKDTTGSGKADLKVRVLEGLDTADTHHTSNSFVFDPGGAVYFQEGVFHHTSVESPWGPPARRVNAGVFRYEPRAQKFEVYVAYGFANPHGHVFDHWGQDIVHDGTGAQPYHAALFSGQVDYPHGHPHAPQVYDQKTRPCPGTEILSSRHFPPEMQGNLLVGNVIGFRGILRYQIKDKGASFVGIEQEPILSSSDLNFRPADIKIGPDGAIYFSDWHNPIIGHMQHHIRDPNRDHEHGRVYRVTYEGRPLLKPHKIAGEPIDKLLELLKEPEDRVRYWTRSELGSRNTKQVLAALQKWVSALDKKDASYEHHLMEALWLYQNHNVVNEGLLKRMLRSPDFHARAAATRVLCYWRDRVKEPLQLLQVQINDSAPRVRLEAIRALSFFSTEEALNVALELLAHPDDEYLRYTFNETLTTLERRLGSGQLNRKNLAASLLHMLESGKVPAARQPQLIETILKHGSAKELDAIWYRALDPRAYTPALRRRVLEGLAEAALTRKAQPAKVNPTAMNTLLRDASADPKLMPAALRLVAAWKEHSAQPALFNVARGVQYDLPSRYAALEGLAALGGAENKAILVKLAEEARPLPVRYHAAVALAQLDLKAGAEAAAVALTAGKENDDPSYLVEAFLQRKQGSEALAAALGKHKLAPDTAKQVLRAMYLAGRNDAALGNLVSKYAGIEAEPKAPTPDEVRQLAHLAVKKGDAARGERVFRRADLGCIKCHAINKAGGTIGPDLGPLGGSSPIDYVITSILDPSASIKEEYLTKLISTTDGQVVTGIVVERSKNLVVLKDATGKLVRIPTANIDEETNGKSLMPEGITRILTKNELLDLIRFVSELGKPGPYAIPKASYVRRWKMLRELPDALREGIPNRDVLRDAVLHAPADAWEPVYTQVNGTLPLKDLKKAAGNGTQVYYLQGEVQVVQEGKLKVKVNAGVPVAFWVDEEPFEKDGTATVNLPAGRHSITVRVVVPADAAAPTLRVELSKPGGVTTHFEVVNGG
jgi:putative heme-binding domain-containing protein